MEQLTQPCPMKIQTKSVRHVGSHEIMSDDEGSSHSERTDVAALTEWKQTSHSRQHLPSKHPRFTCHLERDTNDGACNEGRP